MQEIYLNYMTIPLKYLLLVMVIKDLLKQFNHLIFFHLQIIHLYSLEIKLISKTVFKIIITQFTMINYFKGSLTEMAIHYLLLPLLLIMDY